MNGKDAIEQFEQDLRKAVRRLSRENFDDSITEVSNHFQDLLSESLRSGKSDSDAESYASRRIGSVGDIARKIVESPAIKQGGHRLQWIAVTLWIGIVYIHILALRYFGYFMSLSEFFLVTGDYILFLIGCVAGIGVFKSRSVSWRSLLTGFVGVMAIFLVSFPIVYGSFAKYESGLKQHMSAMSRLVELEPHYVKYEGELSEALANQSISDDRLKAIMKDIKADVASGSLSQTAVVARRKPLAAYPYPTGVQKILPTRPASIFWDSTHVYEIAKSHWKNADQLHNAIPAMAKGRQFWFADLRRIVSMNRSWPIIIGRFAFGISWQFVLGLLVGWTLMRIRIYRRDTFRIRRA